MRVIVNPSKAEGTVKAPPSKSLAHRALISGAFTDGSEITNIAFSKDISATLSCLESLGAEIEINKDTVKIGSLDLMNVKDNTELFCNESGSTLRFMIPICLLTGKKIILKGAKRLFERPLGIYEDICKSQNILFEKKEDSLTVCGKISSGNYRIPGDISSQFITGLLFALPLAEGFSILEITGKFESASYIDLTLDVLSKFGIRITRMNNRFIIPGNQKYQSRNYKVEGDCSNAAFLEAFNYLGGNAVVEDISQNTLQGDRVYKEIFEDIQNGKREFDLSDCPDLGPVLFAFAAAKGGAKFNGTARLKIKESDRAEAMKEELAKFGINVIVEENSVTVENGILNKPAEILNGHNDHRIVMSLAVLATLVGGEIQGAEAVTKSFPDFFEVLKTLKLGIEIYEA